MRRFKKLLLAIPISIGVILGIPATVYAIEGIDNFQAYLEALEYGLLGLIEYFGFVLRLFEMAVS